MPVGAAGVGAAGVVCGAFLSEFMSSSSVLEFAVCCRAAMFEDVGDIPGVAAQYRSGRLVIIATNASELESGDQTIVSGKWTAIVSDVSFLWQLAVRRIHIQPIFRLNVRDPVINGQYVLFVRRRKCPVKQFVRAAFVKIGLDSRVSFLGLSLARDLGRPGTSGS